MKRAASILCIAVVCAFVAGGSVARANPAPSTIATGVTIGTVDVGGMTAGQATAAVNRTYFAPVKVRVKHHVFTVKTSHFHTSAPIKAAVQTALTAPASTVVPLRPKLSMKRVHKWVKTLAAHTYHPVVPGVILIRHGRPVLRHEHAGYRINLFVTRILIRDALQNGTRTTIFAPLRVLNAPSIKSEAIIVIHRGLNRLVLFRGSHRVRTFPVATGQAIYPTPLGEFTIVVKEINPWWYPPTQDAWAKGLKPVPPGPGNPLGTRWMGLSAPGVGIHGTDEPWSIGHSESHGCIRMQVPDAEWLYPRVRVGTPVFIISS